MHPAHSLPLSGDWQKITYVLGGDGSLLLLSGEEDFAIRQTTELIPLCDCDDIVPALIP